MSDPGWSDGRDADRTVQTRTFDATDRTQPPAAYGIELSLSEAGSEPHQGPRAVCEVVTQNSVFRLDASSVCFEVIDRATHAPQPGHRFVGRRLVGGQRRLGETVWLCHPVPLAGSAAVFAGRGGRGQYFTTSPVETVNLRVISHTVPSGDELAAWTTIDGIGRATPRRTR